MFVLYDIIYEIPMRPLPSRLPAISVAVLLISLGWMTAGAAHAQNLQPLLNANAEQPGEEQASEVFAPGVISSPDSSESSPSITADGRTLVFTRYASYGQQVPYIATRTGDSWTADAWTVERAPFAEIVYNLAISPDGATVLFRTTRTGNASTESVSRVFRVERTADGTWGEAEEVRELRGTRAGYFDLQDDGSLYLYARPAETGDDPDQPRGVYRTERQHDGSYGPLVFVGRAVSPAGTNTFSPELFDGGRQMIVTRAGISAEEEADLGQKGFYLHRRTGSGWDNGTRLPLPYGWDATILPGNRLLYVDRGDVMVLSF